MYEYKFSIGTKDIDINSPPYFIADIAANHDGSIERAVELIHLAKEAGADCAKFQHFEANKIVSDVGFSELKSEDLSHQATWKKSVAEIYDQYHTNREWNQVLIDTCKKAEIEFMTTPYDVGAIEELIADVNAIKIGSGDITYEPFLKKIAKMSKPLLMATGAANLNEVMDAVDIVLAAGNTQLCLLQCNTNYTGDVSNFSYVNLNVLKTFATIYPNMPMGLSDHTPGHSVVLGAIALGARVIEKHFTDDNRREGPDHHFALNPTTWREMVDASYELTEALGNGVKRVEDNENKTVVIQRRAVRVKRELSAGELLSPDDLECLRPCPKDAYTPMYYESLLGRKLLNGKKAGECLYIGEVDV